MANYKKQSANAVLLADKMRKSVLQAAIEGKLTTQNPAEDGDAHELLAEIQAEKQRLIAAGEIKREKVLPAIDESELPFDIPDNWVWVRFGNLVINRDSERIPLSQAERIGKAKIYDYYGASGVIDKVDDFIYDEELLLIGEDGANLLTRSKPIAFKANGKYWVNNHAHVLKPLIDIDYLCAYINTIPLHPYVTGTAQPKMNQEKMNSILVSVPPLSEQKRIIQRLEQILPQLDRLQADENKLHAMQIAFPNRMQASLLQAAIEGKLTTQNPKTDGTASYLLEQIQAEKQRLVDAKEIKREKPLPAITEEEKPFDIPENWEWVRLSEISTKVTDGDHNPPKGEFTQTQYIMGSSTNIGYYGLVNLNKIRYLSKENFDKVHKRTKVIKDDILFASVGSIGNAIVFNEDLDITFQRSVTVITCLINPNFLRLVLLSPYCQYIFKTQSTGTAQKGFYINQVMNLVIPIAPLAEQERIVAKLDALLPKVQALKDL